MKRLLLIILCAAVCAVVLGCTPSGNEVPTEPSVPVVETPTEPEVYVLPDDYIFPVGTRIFGNHVGRLSISDAADMLNEAVGSYTLDAAVNDSVFHFTGRTLELSCNEAALADYAVALETGEDTSNIDLLDYNRYLLRRRVGASVNTRAVNTSIYYDEETELYALTPSSNGWHVEMDTLMATLDSAIQSQQDTITINLTQIEDLPEIADDSYQATNALDKANTYLTTEITYNFTTLDDDIESETITRELLLSMIDFGADLQPYIKEDVLKAWISEMDDLYGKTGIDDAFYTTGGSKTELTVTYYAQLLDVDALYEEILYYLDKGISGTRLPPELDTLTPETIPYGGSYIEIDLTNQTLYLYKETECILETPVVTGCVSRYMRTPTGVYKVLTRRMHVILKGEDYETYVKYWMQFHGGYGLHDAYWRSNFRSNEYLYNGSHGCVNIPPTNAAFIFENIHVGYPVVLYGGASNDGPLQQDIVGTDTYDTNIYTEPFQLDAKLTIGSGTMTYTSSNPAVASVTEDGTVTVHKTGKAVIEINYEESRYYTGATLKVTINVEDPCKGDHTFGSWLLTKKSSCENGEKTRTCKNCDKYETMTVPANQKHCYGAWEVISEPECVEGEESRACIVCGDITYRQVPAQHSLRDWKVRTKPTCEEPGEHYRACRYCDYEETETLPALGHSFYPDEEFCEKCDATNPNWIPPTEPKKEDEE